MDATQTDRTEANAKEGPLVMVRTEDGYRVYSPANPGRSYVVSGGTENPTCTCPDFQHGRRGERCMHIAAVLNSFGRQAEEDQYAVEERRAIQNEHLAATDESVTEPVGAATQMLVKRSVSPDGRIDALSVEFSTMVDGMAPNQIADRAARLLALQSAIAKGFLDGVKNGNVTQPKTEHGDEANGAALAEMVSIGGMNGKWGRRLFITIQVGDKSLRLFGSKAQLADTIRNTGFPTMAERIEEGVALRVPCRIITKPSPDGKYVNIDRVLPVQMPEASGRAPR